MTCYTNYEDNTAYNSSLLYPYLPMWQSIAYKKATLETMLELTSCCKFFQSKDFSRKYEIDFWKPKIFNLLDLKKSVNKFQIELISKHFFCCLKKAGILVKKSDRDEVKKTLTPYSDFLSKCESNPKTVYYNAFLKDSREDFIKNCKFSAKEGFAPAQNTMGHFYYDDDISKAFKYFQLSADKGNAIGQLALGDYYLYGDDANNDTSKSFHYYLLSAKQGNAEAQWNVGDCYRLGIGPKKVDRSKAFKFYELSAKKHNPIGLSKLAVCYEEGIGVKVDLKKAMEHYKQAVILGNIIAKQKLADLQTSLKQNSKK